MEQVNPPRRLATAALTAAVLCLPLAAHYLVPVFFIQYLEPWFWPFLAALVTGLALLRLHFAARRQSPEHSWGRAGKALVFAGQPESAWPAVVWVCWTMALFATGRYLALSISGDPGLSAAGQVFLGRARQDVPFLVWPLFTLALAVPALVTGLRARRMKRKGGVLPSIIALVLALLFAAGDIYLLLTAREINDSSQQMIEDEIQGMIEEAKSE